MLYIFLLVGFFVSLILISWIWPPDSPWSPRWRTKKNTARFAFKLSGLRKGETVYELGSGEATALMVAAKEFGAKGVGIEIEPLRYLLSKFSVWRNGLSGNIELIRGNFFDQELSDADVIYSYLVTKTQNRLVTKYKRELKKGTRIICYKYKMDLPVKKEDKKNELTLYVI